MRINAKLTVEGSLIQSYADKAVTKIEDVNPPLRVLFTVVEGSATDADANAGGVYT